MLFTMDALVAFLTLTFLEIILGIDNVIFISIVTGKFILEQRDLTLRYMGSRNQKLLIKGVDF